MRNKKGITLIALVITIIVLLILAGVSISTITSKDGIVSKAQGAKEKTEVAKKEEEEYLSGLESYIDSALDDKDEWAEILADANLNPSLYEYEGQETSTLIGIGTDAKPVNMDLWDPTLMEDGNYKLGGSAYRVVETSYCGTITDSGEIEGAIPAYIYDELNKEFKPVTVMAYTFYGFSGLTVAPEIPDNVEAIIYAFARTGLSKTPKIKKGVTTLEGAFEYCENLTEVSKIPDSVTNIIATFRNCTSLTEAPEIPNSVTKMSYTFSSCTALNGNLVINANPTEYTNCLRGAATEEGCSLVLSGNSSVLTQILATATGNVSIVD